MLPKRLRFIHEYTHKTCIYGLSFSKHIFHYRLILDFGPHTFAIQYVTKKGRDDD